MAQPDFDKLVRDEIPRIIEQGGKKTAVKRLVRNRAEHLAQLCDKLHEEAEELRAAKTPGQRIEELADLFEVLRAYMAKTGIRPGTVEHVRRKKRLARGGFERGIVLVRVVDVDSSKP